MSTTDAIIKHVGGKALLRKPNNENDFWRIEQIYQGSLNEKPEAVRVPNVGDIVIDTSQGVPRWLEVQYVDEISLIPDMVELESHITKNEFSHENRLLGVGPGYQSELWRLYLDTSVIPHIFIPDGRLHIYGKENTKYKIFKGTDTSAATSKCISMNFNNNGELISEDIPLEKVAFPLTDEVDTNYSVKVCRRGYTTTKLEDGDIVTLVTYSESGSASSYNTLMVHNTALDRQVEASTKYITTIGIESPFLDKTENNTLIFPMNIPRDALAMMGIITYSDGSVKRIPVGFETGRLQLLGYNNYIPMKKDQNINLTLVYHLADGEQALNASVGEGRFISVKYFGRTLQVDGSYSVNIFPIPTYVSREYGWSIKYLLYSLDRDVVYDVTNVVEAGATTKPFNPKLFNETQDISIALDLQNVDARLRRFRHVQTFKIALLGHPTAKAENPWTITYEKDQEPNYGNNIICRGVRDPGLGRWRLDIRCGANNLQEWLEKVYYRILPLTDKYSEKRPPKPTHFTLIINDVEMSYPISAWNQVLDSEVGAHDGYGVIVQWTRVDGMNQYQLGASPLCFIDVSEGNVVDHAGTTIVAPNQGNGVTIIDIDEEVKRIADRGASLPVQEKYRQLLEIMKRHGLLKYEDINAIFQRIRNEDVTAAQIANDVILLELEIGKITISDFNRETLTSGKHRIPSMETQR